MMFLAQFATIPTLSILLQESERGRTPIWVIAIIVLLIILLFWWGQNHPSKSEGVRDDSSHDGHGDHGAVTESAHATVEHQEEPAVVEVVSETAVATPDDLKRIEGIGPKIETILNDAGISTFAQLAATTVPQLEKIVREDAGIRVAFPASWPEQAQLAATGEWDALQKLQDELNAGRTN